MHAYANRIPRRQVHPIQSSLHVRKTWLQLPNDIRVRSDTKAHAVHHAGKAHVRSRQDINVRPHSGRDMHKLPFAEVADGPPGARINQREHFLPHMRIRAFRNIEVCDEGIEGRIDPAFIEVIVGIFPRRFFRATLIHKGLSVVTACCACWCCALLWSRSAREPSDCAKADLSAASERSNCDSACLRACDWAISRVLALSTWSTVTNCLVRSGSSRCKLLLA